jgi:phosphatidylglycerophosphate synthase
MHATPAVLTGIRALLVPVLVLLTHFHGSHLQFGICLTVAFLSDVFDGVIARRLGIATPGLRRFDSATDSAFYLAALYAAWQLDRAAITSRIGPMIVLGILEASRYAFDWLKFRREASYHMWSSKLWGVALFAAFFSLLACGSDNALMSLAIYLGIAADLEGLAISVILPEWQSDVATIVHAIALRRRSSASRLSLR